MSSPGYSNVGARGQGAKRRKPVCNDTTMPTSSVVQHLNRIMIQASVAYLADRRAADARACVAHVVVRRHSPEDVAVRLCCAQAYLQEGNPPAARQELDAVLPAATSPASSLPSCMTVEHGMFAYLLRATAGAMDGDHAGVLADVQRAEALCPIPASAHVMRGRARVHMGEHDDAIHDLGAGLQLASDSAADTWRLEALYWRGVACTRVRRYTDAAADLEELLRVAPEYMGMDARFRLAHIRMILEDYDGAVQDFDVVLTAASSASRLTASALRGRACAHARAGHRDAAAIDLHRADELDPSLCVDTLVEVAFVKAYIGRVHEALTDLDLAHAITRTDARVQFERGCVFWMLGDSVKAYDAWASAAQLDAQTYGQAVEDGPRVMVQHQTRAPATASHELAHGFITSSPTSLAAMHCCTSRTDAVWCADAPTDMHHPYFMPVAVHGGV